MGLFSFDRSKSSARLSRKARSTRRTSLSVESLETRLTPSGNTISGFVYVDGNNNGLYEPGETPIANPFPGRPRPEWPKSAAKPFIRKYSWACTN